MCVLFKTEVLYDFNQESLSLVSRRGTHCRLKCAQGRITWRGRVRGGVTQHVALLMCAQWRDLGSGQALVSWEKHLCWVLICFTWRRWSLPRYRWFPVVLEWKATVAWFWQLLPCHRFRQLPETVLSCMSLILVFIPFCSPSQLHLDVSEVGFSFLIF